MHLKGKENKVSDALTRKVQEMHVESISNCESFLRQHIINHNNKDEMDVQVKETLQQQSLENKYEGYKLEEDGLLTYKSRMHIPNVVDLRRVVMDEIHQNPYPGHPGY